MNQVKGKPHFFCLFFFGLIILTQGLLCIHSSHTLQNKHLASRDTHTESLSLFTFVCGDVTHSVALWQNLSSQDVYHTNQGF